MLSSLWSYAIIGFKCDNDTDLPLQYYQWMQNRSNVARGCNSGRPVEAAAAAATWEGAAMVNVKIWKINDYL